MIGTRSFIKQLLLAVLLFTECLVTGYLFTGCSSVHGGHSPIVAPFDVPQNFSQAAGSIDSVKAVSHQANIAVNIGSHWWRAFDDSQLNHWVDEALNKSFRIEASIARRDQMEAIFAQATAPLFPFFTISSGGALSKQPQSAVAAGLAAARGLSTNIGVANGDTLESYQMGGAISYELDLWGKLRAGRSAAQADFHASEFDLQTVRISIAAEVSRQWILLRQLMAQEKLLQQQLDTNQSFLELITMRYNEGLASALDIDEQSRLLAFSSAQLAGVSGERKRAQNGLALLLSRPPQNFSPLPLNSSSLSETAVVGQSIDALPSLPPLPEMGIPAALIDRRPDLRATRQRLQSAGFRQDVAMADLLPAVRLSASITTTALSIASLFEEILWSLATNIEQSVFQGGRKFAVRRQYEAAQREQMARYAEHVLIALVEFEHNLVLERSLAQQRYAQGEQVHFAAAALEKAKDRYLGGLNDFSRVLMALQALQSSEVALLSTQGKILLNRIQLYRSLAGGITDTATEIIMTGSRHNDQQHNKKIVEQL